MNVHQYEALALARLDPMVSDYYAGGAEDERTLQRNVEAWSRWRLRQRVLVNVSDCQTQTTVLGTPVALPVLVAPTAYQCLADPEGECATARAAAAVGTVMTVSSLSTRSLEEIAAIRGGPLWFQLYTYRDRTIPEALVRRAEAAGYKAIMLTVDVPAQGLRERDLRNGFGLPAPLKMANFEPDALASLQAPGQGASSLAHYIDTLFDPSLDWRIIDWLRSKTSLPIMVKGIMTGQDASRAVASGVNALIVSNHGGRQLDDGQGTADVLEEVIAAVQARCEVYVDGGLRRGRDVLKALALGARAVLVGRPVLWGLTVAGEAGVAEVLQGFGSELKRTMQFCGCTRVSDLDSTVLATSQ